MRIFLLVAALLLALPSLAPCWQCTSRSVHDGDSLKVLNDDNAQVSIRLYGIDAPEAKQPYGPLAKRQLSKMVARKALEVTPVENDRYGRTLALIRIPDGNVINFELVLSGSAWVDDTLCTRPEICDQLRAAQDEARAYKRGLWADADAVPPWEWRKAHKSEEWYVKPARALGKAASKVNIVVR